jgi:hypothetical protein
MQPSISSRQIGIWRLQWFQIFNKATATIPIMKQLLFPALLLLATSGFAQNEPRTLLYLTDGSFLKGTIEDTLPGAMLQVRLTDGSKIEVSQNLILKISKNKVEEILLRDGRRVLDKGIYYEFSIYSLSAQLYSERDENLRWGLGAHYSMGYQFSPMLAVGAGIGIDAHKYFLMPVFVEVGGILVKRNQRPKKEANREVSWHREAIFVKKRQGRGRQFPLSYNLQAGYNFPIEEAFTNDGDFTKVRGGWMVYPSVGILFPSRTGASFRLDAGYKFQGYKIEYRSRWTNGFLATDKVLLKSMTIRLGLIF